MFDASTHHCVVTGEKTCKDVELELMKEFDQV